MKAKGATIVEGNAMKPETLLPLYVGIDVVVSAIGNNETTKTTSEETEKIVS